MTHHATARSKNQPENKTKHGIEAGEPANRSLDEREIRATATALAERFGIESAFVRVATLARILGLSSAAVYTAMREGRFFIPHRSLNSAPVVKLDDLARWYCGSDIPALAPQAAAADHDVDVPARLDLAQRLRKMRESESSEMVEKALMDLSDRSKITGMSAKSVVNKKRAR